MKRLFSVLLLTIILAGCLCLTACRDTADDAVSSENALSVVEANRLDEFSFSYDTFRFLEAKDPKLQKPDSYAIIRKQGKEYALLDGRLQNGKKADEAWTQEDIDSLQYVVIAVSVKESAKYQSTSGGKTVTVTRESVNLFCFDCEKQELVKAVQITGKQFPQSTQTPQDYTIANYRVKNKGMDLLHLPYFRPIYYLFIGILLAVGVMLLIARSVRKKQRETYAGKSYVIRITGTQSFNDGDYAECRATPGYDTISVGDAVTLTDASRKVKQSDAKITAMRNKNVKAINALEADTSMFAAMDAGGVSVFIKLDCFDTEPIVAGDTISKKT